MAYDPTHPSAPSALTDSERALLEALPGGAAVFRVDGGLECRYYSESLAELSGRSAAELQTAMASSGNVRALVEPADWDHVRGQVLDKVSRGESFSFSFHCLAPDGAPRWLHVNASRLREENGRPLYCFLIARPSQETELYRQLADDSPTAVLVVDKDTRRIVYANRAWKSMEGVPSGGCVAGRTLAEVTNRPRTFLTDEQRAGLTRDFQAFHIERSDGRNHRILIKIGDWSGTPVYIMHITDETESYLGQAKLQRLLDRLPGGVGICDLAGGEGRMRYLNDGFFRMLGLGAEERDAYSHQPLQTLASPEDWELLEKTRLAILAGQDTADFNWRISLGNGTYRWVRMVCAAVERTGERCVLYVCFSDMDAEIKLRQELDYNRAMLDEAMKAEGLAVWQYDIQTHEIRLSEYAKRIFRPGVAPVDGSVTALGQSGLHPDDLEAYASMAESLAAGRLPPPLVVRYHAPGSAEEWRWLRVTCTSILQKDGRPKTAMASALDVTDEVRAKQRYQEELSYRQVLGQNLLSSHRVNLTKMEVEESHTLIRPDQTDPGQTVSAAFQQQVSLPYMPDPEERKAYMATFGFEKMLRDFMRGVRELSMDYRVRMPDGDVRWVCKKSR